MTTQPASASSCPYCGEDPEPQFYGLDLVRLRSGEQELVWLPCCMGAREHVEAFGWTDLWGESLATTSKREIGRDVSNLPTAAGLEL